MALREGQQVDTLPVQVYGDNGATVRIGAVGDALKVTDSATVQQVAWLLSQILDRIPNTKTNTVGSLNVVFGTNDTSYVYTYGINNVASGTSQLVLSENPARTAMMWNQQAMQIGYC